jgi:hypothetical protein
MVMASNDAWTAGVNIAQGKRGKKKDDTDSTDDSQSSKPVGGLLGAAGRGIAKLRGKKQAAGGGATTTSALIPGENIPVFKHGGRVRKTGVALVHRGELIIPAKRRSTKAPRKRTVVKR